MITAIPAWRPGCSAQKSASQRLYAHAPTRLQLPVGALRAGTARRVERRRVVLRAVGEDHVGDDAVGLELHDAAVGVERAGAPARRRGLGVVLLGHELGIEQLRHALVELAPLLRGVLAEPVEVRGVDVLRRTRPASRSLPAWQSAEITV